MMHTEIPLHKKLLIPLIVSLLFFVRKGIQYALIGSYLPLLLSTFFTILLVYAVRKKAVKSFRVTMKIWSILLIIWALVRLLLAIVNVSMKPLSEYHINYQIGIGGSILSLTGLWLGIHFLLKTRKKEFNL
ncbi:hypothetical protein RQM59_05345 [Flavobacteriaceae bacterium S356]|uniref:Uncharacterized protein n=1 Tax=Asprobacillus argus TaxID=3076534 RepID=A0ABU3LDK0_9FLAO|nr:hypothetical protein [Flavobacteriaceae bacterium S356]